jgi:hypothetical protein
VNIVGGHHLTGTRLVAIIIIIIIIIIIMIIIVHVVGLKSV